MLEWIGQFIADWPIVLIFPIAVFVALIAAIPYDFLNNVWPRKKEWWQDREMRLTKELTKEKQKNKAKKG